MSKREEAKRILVNYFELLMQFSGMYWRTRDTENIEQAIDAIIDAAIEEIKQQSNPPAEDD